MKDSILLLMNELQFLRKPFQLDCFVASISRALFWGQSEMSSTTGVMRKIYNVKKSALTRNYVCRNYISSLQVRFFDSFEQGRLCTRKEENHHKYS